MHLDKLGRARLSPLLLLVIASCTTTSQGFKTYVARYESASLDKALVCAVDEGGAWACGAAVGEESIGVAEAKARNQCERTRATYRVQSPCRLTALNDLVALSKREAGPQLRFRYIVSKYHERQQPRALACAFETEARWVCTLAYLGDDLEANKDRALARCEQERTRSDVLAPCEIIAENERVRTFPAWWTPPELGSAEPRLPGPASPPTVAPPTAQYSTTAGTCFAVSPDGRILTAYHVIEDATALRVSFDGASFEKASVQSLSPALDVALLRVAKPLETWLALGTNESARVGDEVFTLGFPVTDLLGNEPKFTDGTISALSGLGGEFGYMQISVPVQPGNSGGPLVNWRGEVVGVVIARAAELPFLRDTGVLPQNINWAVKASVVRPLVGDVESPPRLEGRRQVIDHTQASVCQVEATVRQTN